MTIVLDEQLMGRGIEVEISHWYRGAVIFVTALRPDSVIKDDGIPALLSEQRQPTFVTINERDFWRRVPITSAYTIICFALPDSEVQAIPVLLRRVLNLNTFSTKAKRMGYVIRVANESVTFYSWKDASTHHIEM